MVGTEHDRGSRFVPVMVPNPSLRSLAFLLPPERCEVEEIVRVQGEIETALIRRVRVEQLTAAAKEDAEPGQFTLRKPYLPRGEKALRIGIVVFVLGSFR